MLNGEENCMILKKTLVPTVIALLIAAFAVPGPAQVPAKKAPAGRGKAELKTPDGTITVDYGRPSLAGRDMLSQLNEGDFWRMGQNQATVLTTPTDLTFGKVKVPKGSFSLWLQRTGERYDLIFNSQTGQSGMDHDPSKDLYKAPMTKANTPNSVEVFTLDLKPVPQGGVFEMNWGTTKLSTDFQFAK
jgi:hypothetical protein